MPIPASPWMSCTGTVRWIEEQLERVLVHHQASVGYSTCFWYNVLHSQALFDRAGWFAELQRRPRQPYPEELQRAIIGQKLPAAAAQSVVVPASD